MPISVLITKLMEKPMLDLTEKRPWLPAPAAVSGGAIARAGAREGADVAITYVKLRPIRRTRWSRR